MDGLRARDADRDRFVELIEAAYVDGQLGAEDRELRVSRALSAETVDELRALTRDLQVPAGAVARDVAAPPTARPRLTVQLVAFLALVALLGLGAVSLVLTGESDSATSSGVAVEVESAPAEPQVVTATPFRMEPDRVRAFVRAYEEEFGTTEAFEVGFHPERVQAQVPVRGTRPRMERWTWDGTWSRLTEARAVVGPYRRVDVQAIDVRRLFANIATARRTLQVEDGRFSHALLLRWDDGGAELNIYVSNDYDETGHLSTTPAGQVVRSHPYES